MPKDVYTVRNWVEALPDTHYVCVVIDEAGNKKLIELDETETPTGEEIVCDPVE